MAAKDPKEVVEQVETKVEEAVVETTETVETEAPAEVEKTVEVVETKAAEAEKEAEVTAVDIEHSWVQRVHDEYKELADKVCKLEAFLIKVPHDLNLEVRELMNQQLMHMKDYASVLRKRISLF